MGPLDAVRLNLRQVVLFTHAAGETLGQPIENLAKASQRLDETMPDSRSDNYRAARDLLDKCATEIEGIRDQLGGIDQIIEALAAEL